MGIPLVQGGDLLVLDDHVYLKTVRGLEARGRDFQPRGR